MKHLLLLPILLCSLPVSAQQVTVQDTCTRIQETYVPGYQNPDGSWVSGIVRREKFAIPCGPVVVQQPVVVQPAPVAPVTPHLRRVCDPSRTLLGMTLGGGVGAVLSRGDGRWWAIPLGAVVGGTAIGC